MRHRCPWCGTDPLYTAYHDEEWGVPVHDDRALFELLSLEGAQAGLSWITVLRKRQAYREAFHGFDIARVASYDDADVARLLANAGIVRNRLKVRGAIRTARAVTDIQARHGSLDVFLWAFVGGAPRVNHWTAMGQVPTSTPEALAMSRALQKAGATFVGPTICYAFMQAAGLVDDHCSCAGSARRTLLQTFDGRPSSNASHSCAYPASVPSSGRNRRLCRDTRRRA